MKIRYVRRIISLALAILMMLSALSLTSCSGGGEAGETTTPVPDGTSGEDTTSAQENVTSVTDAEKGKVDDMTIGGVPIKDYKIVYYDTEYAKACARQIQLAIESVTGNILTIIKHTGKVNDYEILVGKTGRDESNAVRESYDRPNVYYDVKLSGKKLVVMGEGYTVLNEVTEIVVNYIKNMSNANPALDGAQCSGNIKDKIDTLKKTMVERADGTDLRVFHWNFAAPYLNDAAAIYKDNKTRGEVMADIVLQMYPDIITTNEFYESHNGNTVLFDAVMGELGEYYTCLKSPYDKDKPVAGADAIKGKTINSNIIYRNDAGLTVVGSSWRYSTETTTVSGTNPFGFVYYHGSHTAVFSQNGRKFVVSVSHYADSRSDSKWAKEHLAAISDAIDTYGEGKKLPVILTGDLYTGFTSTSSNSGYKYLVAQGYIDSQRYARVNANSNDGHGTFHTIGVRQINRISEDFVWYTEEMESLCFKVLTSKDIDETSDHYPVVSDIKFK